LEEGGREGEDGSSREKQEEKEKPPISL